MKQTWQLCPKCDGEGLLSHENPDYVKMACNLCYGHKVISNETGKPPVTTNSYAMVGDFHAHDHESTQVLKDFFKTRFHKEVEKSMGSITEKPAYASEFKAWPDHILHNKLKAEANNWKQRFNDTLARYKELQKAHEQLKENVDQLREIAKHNLDNCIQWQNRSNELLVENQELKRQIDQLENTVARLNDKLQHVDQENDGIIKLYEKQVEDYQELEEKREKLKEDMNEQIKVNEDYKIYIKDLEEKVNELRKKYSDQMYANNDLIYKIDRVSSKLSDYEEFVNKDHVFKKIFEHFLANKTKKS